MKWPTATFGNRGNKLICNDSQRGTFRYILCLISKYIAEHERQDLRTGRGLSDMNYVGVAIYVRTNDRVFLKHGDKKL